jgi:outer membrane receptor protein involved in Fe transport
MAGSLSAQQNGRITGRVTDATSSAPLSEVQVYIAGGSLGSLTGQNGRYVILNVPAGTHELRVERIGLTRATRQVTVAAGATVEADFTMETQALGLDEIVVTGTAGAARRREVGNAIAQIDVAQLPDRPVSVSEMLTAAAPGVEVSSLGGETGQGSTIRLRGTNTINTDTPPVIYIDGVRMMNGVFARSSPPDHPNHTNNVTPSPLDALNPNDIERVEIIKGSAATTLYGTEASAGVIQVFTKRGSSTSAPTWTFEGQQGTLWSQRFGISPVDYLWMDPFINTGFFKWGEHGHLGRTQVYSLSVRGGVPAVQYFVSGGYDAEDGNMANDHLKNWSVRGNFTFTPLTDLVFQWNTAYTNQWQKNTPSGNNAQGITLNTFRQDQNYFGSGDVEVLNRILEFDVQQVLERFTTGGTFTYSPFSRMTNRLTIGYDFSQQENRGIRPFGFIGFPQGGIDSQTSSRRYLTFDYVGSFGFDVMPGLRSNFSWGGQSVGDKRSLIKGWGEGFPGAAHPTVNSASSTLAWEERSEVWNAGFFLQNVLDLNNKYFLTLGVRFDGNSAFGKGFGLAMYPKVSASWVVSDEGFWRPAFGTLKLRAAYGQSGKAPGTFDSQRTWQNTGLDGNAAFTPGNLGNPDLGPEVTGETELGFDGSWLDDMIRTSFTYYKQVTRDAIQNAQSIPSLGFTQSVPTNIGKVENMGTELTLDVSPIRTAGWGLDLSLSHTTNHNNVLEWLDNPDRIGRPIAYSTWTMYVNPDRMGTLKRPEGTYSAQSCTVMVDGVEVPRPGLDMNIHSCTQSSTLVYGYPQTLPPRMVSGATTLRMPFGITFSARGEFRGGHYNSINPIAISRSVRSPLCYPYYINDVDTSVRHDASAIWVARCTPALGGGYNQKADYFKLRTVTATVPVDFAFPDQVRNAMLTVVLGNAYTWSHSPWGTYGIEAGSGERVPPSTTLRASLRLTF